jgi:hypothetical protein
MKLFGIFDKNKNYKLLRYSTYMQNESIYEKYNKTTSELDIIHEICFSDIDYSVDYIGKYYDIDNKNFIN